MSSSRLDPVTFEVLKNSLTTIVDEMAEQILRTCHSFVIWSRDFSNSLFDSEGNLVSEGTQDIAGHVGTLHFTAKATIAAFPGDIHPGDVFAINDPYLGGTHFPDVRILRPVFVEDELIAFAQSIGHWADIGGNVPGSFDINAKTHFSEGLRIPPVRIWDQGRYRQDVVRLIVENTRAPDDAEGDLLAQAEATKVGERELLRLVERYGKETLVTAFGEVQDYVERLVRERVAELPDGAWESEDYIDQDPSAGEGLIPIRVKLEIKGDQIIYDLTGSHATIGSMFNSSAGATYSSLIGATKIFFPDLPLNSGFYRVVDAYLPPDTVVNAQWPTAVAGGAAGAYEKTANAVFELWSQVMPDRAIACCYNVEYLQIGGWDRRAERASYFMWYDWMVGGWGGRNGSDGASATSPIFGIGLAIQPLEGQERLSPVVTSTHRLVPDSGGPGRWRGGLGVEKGGKLTSVGGTVMSYCCDRARSVAWGIEGGLPSTPNGLWWTPDAAPSSSFLGAVFSNVPMCAGDSFVRPSAGGGGLGDPLDRDIEAVLDDLVDGYVTLEGARRDYGVIAFCVDELRAEYGIDEQATGRERARIRESRVDWLSEEAESVAARYRSGEVGVLEAIRRYGVILDWGTGELLEQTTKDFRAMLHRRVVPHYTARASAAAVDD